MIGWLIDGGVSTRGVRSTYVVTFWLCWAVFVTCVCVWFFFWLLVFFVFFFFFSSRRRHTRWNCDWSSDVCSSDLPPGPARLPLRRRPGAPRVRRARRPEAALHRRLRPRTERLRERARPRPHEIGRASCRERV